MELQAQDFLSPAQHPAFYERVDEGWRTYGWRGPSVLELAKQLEKPARESARIRLRCGKCRRHMGYLVVGLPLPYVTRMTTKFSGAPSREWVSVSMSFTHRRDGTGMGFPMLMVVSCHEKCGARRSIRLEKLIQAFARAYETGQREIVTGLDI